MIRKEYLIPLLAFAVFCTVPSAEAQWNVFPSVDIDLAVLEESQGSHVQLSNGIGFGHSVSDIGDVNGDGIRDIVVGTPNDDTGGSNRGAVHVLFMGTAGTVIDSVKIAHNTNGGPGLGNSDKFGFSVAGIGDIDGDGIPDIAVGTPEDDERGSLSNSGAVYILFMNADGTSDSRVKLADEKNGIREHDAGDNFGTSVAGIGDVNGDGIPDIAAGSPNDENDANNGRGAVSILLMNADGTVDTEVVLGQGTSGITLPGINQFGIAVAGIGDVNGDGIPDIAVGEPRSDRIDSERNPPTPNNDKNRGQIWIITLNADGTYKGSSEIGSGHNGGPSLEDDDNFGSAISSLGDIDGDGVPDIAVGARSDHVGSISDAGSVYIVLLNSDLTAKSTHNITHLPSAGLTLGDDDELGFAVASTGDVNGDGIPDLLFGMRKDDTGGNNRGAVYAASLNRDHTLNYVTKISDDTGAFEPAPSDLTGTSIANIGDLNRDGIDDIVLGAPTDLSQTGSGSVHVVFMGTTGPYHTTTISNNTNGGPLLNAGDRFGHSVALIGDVDGDGTQDIAVGSYNQNNTGATNPVRDETVHILFMRPDGTAKSSIALSNSTNGAPRTDQTGFFGYSIAGIGDINNDGIPDIAVGSPDRNLLFDPPAPGIGAAPGRVFILRLNSDGTVSGSDVISGGADIGAANNSMFGASIAAIGDVDGDRSPDLAVGAPGSSSDTGSVYVLLMDANGRSVKTGGIIQVSYVGATAGSLLGASVASLGDIDDDGTPDIAIGVPGQVPDGGSESHGAILVALLRDTGNPKYTLVLDANNPRPGADPVIQAGDGFGSSVTSLGDPNNDGIPDIAVGAFRDDTAQGTDAGSFHVLYLDATPVTTVSDDPYVSSYRTVTEYQGIQDLRQGDRFGAAVSGLGDIDGDDRPDIVVGTPGKGSDNSGSIYVIRMNSNGSPKGVTQITPTIVEADDRLGAAVAGIGNIDSVRGTDIAVGAPNDDTGGENRGAVHILLMQGNVRSVHSRVTIAHGTTASPDLVLENGARFGTSVASIGDMDHNGVPDIAIGAASTSSSAPNDGKGAVYVMFLDSSANVVHTSIISNNTGGGPDLADNDAFGYSIANIGDMDGNGVQDLAVGAPLDDESGDGNSGAVYILFMKPDGTAYNYTKLYAKTNGAPDDLLSGDRFGESVTSLGDINGDGTPDIAVGAREAGNKDLGRVYILTLNSDGTASSVQIAANEFLDEDEDVSRGDDFDLGRSVSGIGDLNGDGRTEIVTGAPRYSTVGHGESGDEGAIFVLFSGTKDTDTSPVLSISAPVSGHTVLEGTEIQFTGKAIDAEDGNISRNIDWSSDIDSTISSNNYGPNISTLSDGIHTITATIQDEQANDASDTVQITVTPLAVDDSITVQEDTPTNIDVLNDDNYPLGSTLTVTISGNPAQGTATVNANNTVLYTPNADFFGTDSFEYSVNDGTYTSKADVSVTVNNTQDPPVANAGADQTAHEGTSVTLNGRGSTDPDNDPITYLWIQNTGNTVSLTDTTSSTPSFSTPEVTDTISLEFTLTVSDGTDSHNDTITITVRDTVTAADDTETGDEDTLITIDVLDNDYQPYTDALVIASVNNGTNGITSIDEGKVLYRPNTSYVGEDSFTYTVSDGSSSDTGTVYVTIQAVNDAPIVNAGTNVTVHEGHSVTLFGTATDVDNDDATLTYTWSQVSGRTATLDDTTSQSLTFDTPVVSWPSETLVFRLTVSDGSLEGTDDVSVQVLKYRAPPVIKISDIDPNLSLVDSDFFGTSVSGIGDLNGDGIRDMAVGAPGDNTGGSDRGAAYVLFMASNGTVQDITKIAHNTGSGPSLGDRAAFGYAVSGIGDINGDGRDEIAVTALVHGTDNKGTAFVLFLNADGTISSIVPIHGGTVFTEKGGSFGHSVSGIGDINRDGTPDIAVGSQDYDGTGAVFVILLNTDGTELSRITISDETGGGPTLSNGDDFGHSVSGIGDINRDGTPDIAIGASGGDRNDRGVAYVILMNRNGTAQNTLKIAEGTAGLVLTPGDNFGDSVTGVGDLDYDGIPDIAIGAIRDDDGGTNRGAVYITYLNRDGTAREYEKISDTSRTITLSNNDNFGRSLAQLGDIDGDGYTELAVGARNDDTGGDNQGAAYVIYLEPKYTRNLDSPAVLSYNATQGTDIDTNANKMGTSVSGIGDINGDGTPDGIAGDPSIHSAYILLYNENSSFTSVRLASNTGGIPTIPTGSFGQAASGIGDINRDGTPDVVIGAPDESNGGAIYVALMNSDGTASSAVRISHNENGGPDLTGITSFGYAVSGIGDINGDGTPDIMVGTLESQNGAAYVLLMNSDGTAQSTVTIAHNENGGPPLTDGDFFGATVSGIGDLNHDGTPDIMIGAFGDGTGGVQRGVAYIILMKSDGTGDSTIKIAHGTAGLALDDRDWFGVSVSGIGDVNYDGIPDVIIGASQDDTGGSQRGAAYIMLLNRNGTIQDIIKLAHNTQGAPTLSNNDQLGDPVSGLGDLNGDGMPDIILGLPNSGTGVVYTMLLNQDLGNISPTAVDDSTSVSEDQSITVSVLENDSDPDDDTLTVTSTTQPSNGAITLHSDYTITYTPVQDYNGPDSFTYTISDGNGGTDEGLVTITVIPVNDAPIAEAGNNTGAAEGTTVTLTGTGSDIDGNTLTYAWSQIQGTDVTLSNPNTATVTFTAPDVTSTETLVFQLLVSDGNLNDTDTVSVTVSSVPTIQDDTATVPEDGTIAINVLNNDSDTDGDTITVTAITQPSNGVTVLNANYTVQYTPVQDYAGTDSFTYTATDGASFSNATVTVTITPVNDAPIADAGTDQSVRAGATVILTGTATDIDDTSFTYAWSQVRGTSATLTNANTATATLTAPIISGTSEALVFRLTVTDDGGATGTANTTVTVSANTAPIAVPDSITVPEDDTITVNVLSNDTDAEFDSLSILSVTQGTNGTVTLGTGGNMSYTPVPDYNGQDSFTYTITDGIFTAIGTVTVTVTPVDEAPVAVADAPRVVLEGTTVTLDGTGSTDVDDMQLYYTWSQESGRPVTLADITANKTTFTAPDVTDTSQRLTFLLNVTDGVLYDTDTITVWINDNSGTNQKPTTTHDSVTVQEDTTVVIPVLNNDSDLDTLFVRDIVHPNANGTATITDRGRTITYTPNPEFSGPDEIAHTVSDGKEFSASLVTVTVVAVNDAPTVNAGADDTVNGGTTVTLAGTATDVDSPTSSLSYAWSQTQGTDVTISNANTATATFTAPSVTTTETLIFVLNVTDGSAYGTDTVSITVRGATPGNTAPAAADDTGTVDEDGTTTIPVLDNDRDADDDSLTILQVTDPLNGAATRSGTSIVYTPDEHYHGTDSFVYTVSDGNGGTDTATVTVTVTPVNDAPTADAGTDQTVNENTTVTLNGTGTDIDGDTLSYSWTQTDGTSVSLSNDAIAGPTFTAPDVESSEILTFELTVSDGTLSSTDTVDITVDNVAPDNNAPTAVDDTATVQEDTEITILVLSNDTDADGNTLRITDTTEPSNGDVTINTGANVTYTPAQDYNGEDSFTYTISDGNGGTDTATVTVTVTPVNDEPIANAGPDRTAQNSTTVTLDGTGSTDVDGIADIVSYSWSQTNGTSVTLFNDTTDTATFTAPELNVTETLTFELVVTDTAGTTDSDSVSITILAIPEMSIQFEAQLFLNTTSAHQSVAGVGPDGTLEHILLGYGNGTIYEGTGTGRDIDFTVLHETDASDFGSSLATIGDINGDDTGEIFAGVASFDNPQGVLILVSDSTEYNEVFVAASDLVSDTDRFGLAAAGIGDINGDGINDIAVGDYRVGSDSTGAVHIITLNGTGHAVNATTIDNSADELSLQRNSYFGWSISYIGDIDNNGIGDIAVGAPATTPDDDSVYVILLNSFNDDSIIKSVQQIAPENSRSFGTSVAGIGDINDDGIPDIAIGDRDAGRISVILLNSDGSEMLESYSEPDWARNLGYAMAHVGDLDGDGYTEVAVFNQRTNTIYEGYFVNIKIVTPNNAPVTVDDAATVLEDGTITINVLDNDADADGNTLTIMSTSTPSNGDVTINAGANVTYTPDENYHGTDSFTYTVSDGTDSTTGTVTVTVTPVNDAPTALDDGITVNEDSVENTISVLDNDSDIDGTTPTLESVDPPSSGTAGINDERDSISYTPNSDFSGTDTFTYTITDGFLTDTATVTVIVTPVNDAPVSDAGDDQTVNEGATVQLDGTGSSDADDGDTLTYSWNQTAGSTVTLSDVAIASPAFTAPDVESSEILTFELTVSDGTLSSTDTVSITVRADDAPTVSITAPADNHQATVGASITFTGTATDTLDGTISDSLDWYSSIDDSIATNTASFTTTSLSTGTHTITANTTDTDGNVGAATLTVTIRADDAPTVSITAPADNHQATVGASITFTGTATDTLDGTISDSLDWYSSIDDSIATNTASFTTTSLSTGTHTITANTTDTDGNVGAATLTVTIRADDAPTVSITAPADNHQATVGASITFTGTATDTLDGTISDSLDWYSSIDDSIATNTASFTTTSLSTGTHTITANTTDTDGNVGAATLTVTIRADDAPTVSITAPADNHQATVGASITFTGTATDTLDGTISDSLDWYSSIDDSIATNTASFTTTSLSTGTHTITANTTDTDGNVGAATLTVTIRADDAPTVSITAPADNHQATVGASITFTGTATDTLDGTISDSLDWYSSIDDSIATNTASFTTTSLSTGTHTITANTTDTDGNVGAATLTVTIRADDAPTVSITAPADNHQATVGASITFTGTATDTLDGTISDSLDWYSSIDDSIATNTASFTTTSLSTGTHTITANTTDTDGNVGAATLTVTIRADDAPTVSITAPADNHQATVGASITFTGTATDTLDGTISDSLDWYSSIDDSIATNTASFTTTSLSTGTHTITANTTDTDGNVGAATLTVTIRADDAPTVSITAPADGHTVTTGTSITFTGTATDTLDGPISTQLDWYSSIDGSIQENSASFSITSLSLGTHTITANVTDTDGNVGSDTRTVTILADGAPTVSISAPADGHTVTTGTSITFTGTATDTLDGPISTQLDWYSSIDGSIQENSASFSITSLSLGTHTITANVTDTDGNVGSDTRTVTILARVTFEPESFVNIENNQLSSVTSTGPNGVFEVTDGATTATESNEIIRILLGFANGTIREGVGNNRTLDYTTLYTDSDTLTFGSSIAYIGDINGDGTGDILVGSLRHSPAASTVLVSNDSDYDAVPVQAAALGITDTYRFGSSVTGIGDVNGDGINDIAIGDHDTDGRNSLGSIHIITLNGTGHAQDALTINNNTDAMPALPFRAFFGWSMAYIGDIDGDGIGDLAVGAPGQNNPELDGTLYILLLNSFDDTSGILKSAHAIKLDDAQSLGTSVTGIGDIDNNGTPDIAIGDQNAERISVILLDSSVAVLEVNHYEIGQSGDLGYPMAHVSDTDDDGYVELVVFGQDGAVAIGYFVDVIILDRNLAPIANAGTDQTVTEGNMVTLDGTGSTDPNDDTLSYSWTQTAGATVTLSDDSATSPTFIAPDVTGPTVLAFQLTVSDGVFDDIDTVTVTVTDRPVQSQGGGRGGFVAAAHLVHFEESGGTIQVTVWGSNVRNSGLAGAIHVPGTDIVVNLVSSPRTDYPLDTTVAGNHRILEGTIPTVPDMFFVSLGDANNFVGTFKSTLVHIEPGVDSAYIETKYHKSMEVYIEPGENHYVLPWD